MPSGKTHSLTTIATGIAGGAILYHTGTPETAQAFITGCLTGLAITPDLDMINKTISHKYMKSIAKLIGKSVFFISIIVSLLWGASKLGLNYPEKWLGWANRFTSIFILVLVLSLFWRLIWLPYGASIPHRAWISHTPIIGLIGRILYFSAAIGLLFVVAKILFTAVDLHSAAAWIDSWGNAMIDGEKQAVFIIILAGLALVDTLHCLMDRWL